MAKKTHKQAMVDKYCNKYKKLPNLTLSKKIFLENNGVFDSAEQIRSMVRSRRGVNGNDKRKCSSDKSNFIQESFSVSSVERQKQIGIDMLKSSPKIPKVLILDIETLPIVSYTWNIGKAYMGHDDIIKDWCILSWAAKWLFDHDVMSDVLTPKEAINRDDKRISKSIWKLINGADIIIAHNGLRFDFVKLNTRFILNGLNPPEPYQMIDTLSVIKKKGTGFSFSSNKLDFLARLVSNKGKIETNKKLWHDCDNGDKEALKRMCEYNKEDVNLLEDVYIFIRNWIKSHPNMALYMDDKSNRNCCPNCGSENIKENNGYYVTPVNKYFTYRCNDCGAIIRSRLSAIGKLSKKDRENLKTTIAR